MRIVKTDYQIIDLTNTDVKNEQLVDICNADDKNYNLSFEYLSCYEIEDIFNKKTDIKLIHNSFFKEIYYFLLFQAKIIESDFIKWTKVQNIFDNIPFIKKCHEYKITKETLALLVAISFSFCLAIYYSITFFPINNSYMDYFGIEYAFMYID